MLWASLIMEDFDYIKYRVIDSAEDEGDNGVVFGFNFTMKYANLRIFYISF
jgi:hypothetical protein